MCADLLVKYKIRDGIKKEVVDTVDGIAFDKQVEIIKEMQKVFEEF